MAKTQILEYKIHLTDLAAVEAYNAQLTAGTGPGQLMQFWSAEEGALELGVLRAPDGAADEFSAAIQEEEAAFTAPSIRSPWFIGSNNFPRDVATFTRKSGGWFGISALFGDTTRFYWVGRFVYAPSTTTVPDPDDDPVAAGPTSKRRWVDGFELPPAGTSTVSGEGGTGSIGRQVSRAASRTVDGFGLALRHWSGVLAHTVMQYRGGGASDQEWSWERFYIRPRVYPSSGEVDLWDGNDGGSAGITLRLDSTGQLLIYRLGVAIDELVATGPVLALDTWTRLDLLFGFRGETPTWATDAPVGQGPGNLYTPGQWVTRSGSNYICVINTSTSVINNPAVPTYYDNSPDGSGGFPHWEITTAASRTASLRVYVNGVQAVEAVDVGVVPGSSVISTTYFHEDSNLGPSAANDAELDFDDWMSADCVTVSEAANGWTGAGALRADYALIEVQIDFRAGSHMQLIRPSEFAADHSADWTGDWRALLQNPVATDAPLTLDCSTASARLSVTTDALLSVKAAPSVVGVVSMVVALYGNSVTTPVDGELGYAIDAGADVLETIDQGAANVPQWSSVLYAPDPMTTFDAVTPLELIHTKGASSQAVTVQSLCAVAELIGTFGEEDDNPDAANATRFGIHNAPYPASPWALGGLIPIAPVQISGGLYVGNDTGQDIALVVQPHWLWVRAVNGTILGYHWWSSMLAAHRGLREHTDAKMMLQALIDPDFVGGGAEDDQETQAILRLSGNDAQCNAAGIIYQYIAICDPGQRYLTNGAFQHDNAVASYVNALAVDTFLPLAAFFHGEELSTSSTAQHWYKGVGHDPDAAQQLSATAPVDPFASLETGSITSQGTSAHVDAWSQCAFSAWRKNDGSGDAGVARVVSMETYTGDASNPRVITASPAVDRYPLFALVQPHNAAAVYRDPSHTGTTSSNIAGGTVIAANGISAGGLGTITVGSQLNASGIVYDVFIIWGGETSCNGGFSCNGDYFPVEPTTPIPTPPWVEPTIIDPAGGGSGTGSGGGGGSTDSSGGSGCVVSL